MKPRDIRKDKSGGIEGLPLQLMIIILVATLGTAVILGWMGNIDTPRSIGDVTAEPGNLQASDDGSIGPVTILVTDQDGNPLEGAAVILTGMGVTMGSGDSRGTAFLETGVDGRADFGDLDVLTTSGGIGFLTVNVSKSGYGENNGTRIVVVG